MSRRHILTVVSIALNVILGSWFGYHAYGHYNDSGDSMSSYPPKDRPTREFKIALITPSTASGPQEVIDGFTSTLDATPGVGFVYKLFDANGSRTLMRSMIEEVLDSNYDLIFSLGLECSKSLRELCIKRRVNAPVVFSAVQDPDQIGIVDSLESSGNNFTGVASNYEVKLQMDLLQVIRPNLKKVLIVFDPSQMGGISERQKRDAEEILTDRGVNVRGIEVYSVNEVIQKVTPFIDGADVVLIPRDHTVISAVEALSKLCSKYQVPLFASDLGSLTKGAVMAFGIRDETFGELAAKQAREILLDGKKPTQIPIANAGAHYKLRINPELLEAQNLHIDSNLYFLMEHGQVV